MNVFGNMKYAKRRGEKVTVAHHHFYFGSFDLELEGGENVEQIAH